MSDRGMTPTEPSGARAAHSEKLPSRENQLATLADCIQGLFDLLARCASDHPELQVQLGEFRDEFYPRLEQIMRTKR